MSQFTNYLEEKVLDHVFRNTSYTSPGTVYLALYSVAPTESTGGTELPVSNGYARQAIAFDAYSAGVCSSSADETFTNTGSTWPTAVALAITDASTGGNILAYRELSSSITVGAGGSVTFAAGKIKVGLD